MKKYAYKLIRIHLHRIMHNWNLFLVDCFTAIAVIKIYNPFLEDSFTDFTDSFVKRGRHLYLFINNNNNDFV